ncbi:MAG TPA: dihydroxyacetone kinase subunit L [Actinobacteria bacterium]|nr:dihydroxyacetone kinase subunit L [Actinomycetota bacterium]
MTSPAARALIFDCDGVLADTERYGHLPAFNQTFEEFGLPVRWSVAEYREKVRIGGGKERLASLLTPEFVAAAGLPADPEGQQAAITGWHWRKTEIYTGLVASGAVPPRPGIARIVGEALAAGWTLAVASTSAEASVRATLERAVGAVHAREVAVFAGDIVAHKKPAPDIYLLALESLGVPVQQVVVVEDSRNGLVAATKAGATCVITVNDFTADEDFAEAALVVSSLGDPGGEHIRVVASRSAAEPGEWVTLADLASVLPSSASPSSASPTSALPTSALPTSALPTSALPTSALPTSGPPSRGVPMPTASFGDVEVVVRTMAQTAVDNEREFGDLDAVVGDGDFGYSMARGFELVLQDWDSFDRADIGTFLKRIAVVITSRIGGTSGPIWGTAFLRAGVTAGAAAELQPAQVVAMLRASIEGIKARGKSDVGDKTLLDALVPAVDTLEEHIGEGHDAGTTLRAAAVTARERAEATRSMQAMRGRASYTGERSIGTLDAGAVAVAVMFEAVAQLWPEPPVQS